MPNARGLIQCHIPTLPHSAVGHDINYVRKMHDPEQCVFCLASIWPPAFVSLDVTASMSRQIKCGVRILPLSHGPLAPESFICQTVDMTT